MDAVLAFSDRERPLSAGDTLTPSRRLTRLQLGGHVRFHLSIPSAGCYALFTEHHPDEFKAELRGPEGALSPTASHQFKPDHEHDEEVGSVGITLAGDLDAKKLNNWMSELLQTQGPDIFRMKGVLSLKDDPNRFVFQGFTCSLTGVRTAMGKEPRSNKLIFIGRNLDREKLTEGFRSCLA